MASGVWTVKPITLVVPTSLQMGWVESPPHICAATKTARDIASEYCDTTIGSIPPHKFVKYVTEDEAFNELPVTVEGGGTNAGLHYALEVFVDDFMSIVIPTSQEQLEHVAAAVMTGIHDVFPANVVDGNDQISEKKLLKGEGQYSLFKTLLGFDFDGKRKTLWLEEEKQAKLLTILHGWIRSGNLDRGIPFGELESVVAKLRHAFVALPGGRGLLSPTNRLLKLRPPVVFYTGTSLSDWHYQTAKQYFVNPPVAQRDAANWLRGGPLCRSGRRIKTGRGRCYHRGTCRMPPNSL
jgi:hypothetical protein